MPIRGIDLYRNPHTPFQKQTQSIIPVFHAGRALAFDRLEFDGRARLANVPNARRAITVRSNPHCPDRGRSLRKTQPNKTSFG